MTFPALSDQSAVLEYLGDPATHHLTAPVKKVETHGAIVFLAGPLAYKVKRAVRYPYMDFSTLEKRKSACEAELAVNRANAPEIYIAVVPISRDHAGLHIGGPGEIVEWVVQMHRFDEEATFDRLADRKMIDEKAVDRLAQLVSDAHRRAPRRSGAPAAIAFHNVMKETLAELDANRAIFPAEIVAPLRSAMVESYHKNELLLFRRAIRGKVRRCHGDLHLRNIARLESGPVLFDAIEFDESIATIDTLYDIAFLIMDLCQRGLVRQACRLLNRYLWLSDDEAGEIEGLALLPLFLALRAAIRAKILATQAELVADSDPLRLEARGYAEAALRFLAPSPPRLIAIGGLSGAGKSVLAAFLAPHIGATPGALHLRSDIERKKSFGKPETARLAPEAYAPNASARIYRQLGDIAETGLLAGRSVIIDAAYLEETERSQIARLAARLGVPFHPLWLEAPIEARKIRVQARRNDASDATVDIVTAQATKDTGRMTWPKIDASGSPDQVGRTVLALLNGISRE